jgi:hypothetical protein
MSTRDFDGEREQREWEAQDRAPREERTGARHVRAAQYRLVARALRHPPPAAVPSDFASRVAAEACAVLSRKP